MRRSLSSIFVTSLLLFSFPRIGIAASDDSRVLISIGQDALIKLQQTFREDLIVIKKTGDVALVQISEKNLPYLSQMMHKTFGRCGGYVLESDDIQEVLQGLEEGPLPQTFVRPKVQHHSLVNQAIGLVQESSIRSTIDTLSTTFRNRLYKSQHGVRSQEWVGAKWRELASTMRNSELEFFHHASYPQRSVIFTIKGAKKPNEVIIVGGHGDSISGWMPGEDVHAPGADDNASGIASLTEVLRVLSQMGFVPDRTIKFMSYAAEEVGLRGSRDVAAAFRQRNENVLGVIQLDMTNYTTRKNEVVIMTDNTNASQNEFLKELLQTYVRYVTIQTDMCGYACSDHASWTRQGYPASNPFEARMNEHNPAIHSKADTLAMSQNSAEHSIPYVQLVLAYLIEMSQQ